MTRRISSKLRPVDAGYVIISRIFFAGSMTNSERTVSVAFAFGWIMSYSIDTFRSASAMIGKLTRVFCVSLMSSIQRLCDSTGSTDSATTFTLRFAKSSLSFAVSPSSVVQTGVKSAGCENSTPHLSPSHSWKLIVPSLDSAVKSGAVSPSLSAMVTSV